MPQYPKDRKPREPQGRSVCFGEEIMSGFCRNLRLIVRAARSLFSISLNASAKYLYQSADRLFVLVLPSVRCPEIKCIRRRQVDVFLLISWLELVLYKERCWPALLSGWLMCVCYSCFQKLMRWRLSLRPVVSSCLMPLDTKIVCNLLLPNASELSTLGITQRLNASCNLFRPMFAK
jgi:hypothetical protein